MRFEEYIQFSTALHELPKIPGKIQEFEHLILYGPQGSGKYTLMLRLMNTYSKSSLKYEKRVLIPTSISPFYVKISDVHCEIDMEQLGCNARVLWHDLFTHIQDMIACTFPKKQGILVCTNIQSTHSELLEILYSYMQQNLKFVLLTDAVSFLPPAVVNRCRILPVPRPSKEALRSCFGPTAAVDTYLNLKDLVHCSATARPCTTTLLSSKIVAHIKTPDTTVTAVREDLYGLLVHNLVIDNCMWHIFKQVLPDIPPKNLSALMEKVAFGLQCYSSNYRPIFHLEYFVFALRHALHTD